jgi:hypothetical protein
MRSSYPWRFAQRKRSIERGWRSRTRRLLLAIRSDLHVNSKCTSTVLYGTWAIRFSSNGQNSKLHQPCHVIVHCSREQYMRTNSDPPWTVPPREKQYLAWTVPLGAVTVRFRSYIRNNTKRLSINFASTARLHHENCFLMVIPPLYSFNDAW